MTPSELKEHVDDTGSVYFHRNNMKFSGDTMSNYGVRSSIVLVPSSIHDIPYELEVWELYRKKQLHEFFRYNRH
jgi:hypothetical protein